MQTDPVLNEAALAHLLELTPVLVLQLDSRQRVVAANVHARRKLGPAIAGRTLLELAVPFTTVSLAAGSGVQLLSLTTEAGVPESFYFRHFEVPDGTVAVGSPDFQGEERMRTQVLELNRELSDLARQVHLTSAELREKNAALAKALEQVKLLSGLLPICASCKKIRDDKGHWDQMETYVQNHSQARFSHGMCPDCLRKAFPDYPMDEPNPET
jgi:hypothetical protein